MGPFIDLAIRMLFVMICENDLETGGLVGSHHAEDISANRRKTSMGSVSEGIFPNFLNIKTKKKSDFRFESHCYINFTRKVILVLMV